MLRYDSISSRKVTIMKIFISFVALLAILVGIGLYQNYQNSLAMCEQYRSSDDFTGYDCPDGQTYYVPN